MLRALAESVRRREELLAQFVESLAKTEPRSTVVLFGSRAVGRHAPHSDFDIAVILEQVGDAASIAEALRRLRPRGLPLDLVVLGIEDLADPIIRSMLKGCVVLYNGLALGRELAKLGCRPVQRA